MRYDKEVFTPYGWGAKWQQMVFQEAGSISDEEIKKFFGALMTKEQEEAKDNFVPHDMVIFNSGKTTLGDIRAAQWSFEHTERPYNTDLREVRVCGYGITEPARRTLEQARAEGLNIRFVDLR